MSIPFRLLTSKDSHHYYALFSSMRSYQRGTLNQIQSVPFIQGEDIYSFLVYNRLLLEGRGMLMPSYLRQLCVHNIRRALPLFMKKDQYINFPFISAWQI